MPLSKTPPSTTLPSITIDSTAPFGYKKDGTPRTRRVPGTGPCYKGSSISAKPISSTPAIPKSTLSPTICCPILGWDLNFSNTKNPQNSLPVYVRYKGGKGNLKQQQELKKMKKAIKTDHMYKGFLEQENTIINS